MQKLIEVSAVDITLYKFILPLMKELSKNNWNISTATNNLEYGHKLEDEGYTVHQIDFARNLSPYRNIKALCQLILLFKREKPDFVHVHTPIASVLARIAAKIAKVPHIVYTLHGLYPKSPFIQIEKFMCRHFTDYIFTVNEEDRVYLIENEFINPHRIKNLNSVGVDTQKFDPKSIDESQKKSLKKELGLMDKPVIGFVGRLVEEKGIFELMDAFINVRSNIDCQLLLIGSDNFESQKSLSIRALKQKAKQAGFQKDVIFAGHREDIPICLSLIEVFVLPSYREGMAISSLEAMSMEIPVIASNIRGCKEEVTFETGILVEKGNISQLSDSIQSLILDREKAISMGKAARKRVKKYFSLEQIVSKQIKIFEKLMQLKQ